MGRRRQEPFVIGTLAVLVLIPAAAGTGRAAGVAGPALHARESTPALAADTREPAGRSRDAQSPGTAENQLYEKGTSALNARQWEQAIEAFGQVAGMGGQRADAALYWKAYAQQKTGRAADALATLSDLRRRFGGSRWLKDASALEIEIRQATGERVDASAEADEELKLLALQGLVQGSPEKALPLLEETLRGNASVRQKERALFLLAQMSSPRAIEVLAATARDDSNPRLQAKAIQSLAVFGGQDHRQLLEQVYRATSREDTKRAVLRAYMVAGDRERVLAAAESDPSEAMRSEAVQQLGVMGAVAELRKLYAKEASLEVKRRVIQALFVGGAADQLMDLARSEPDPELRRLAVRNLGLVGDRTSDFLLTMYRSDKDPAIRKAVLQAFFVQGNASALVSLARSETDPAMKKEIVRNLSLMQSDEATQYLLELLKQ